MAKMRDLTMPCPICQTRIRFPVIEGETSPAQNLPGYVNLHLSLDKRLMREHMATAHGVVPKTEDP